MNNNLFIRSLLIGLITLSILACSNSTPKPYAYYRIDLPEHKYRNFDSIYPPCTFDISLFSNVVPERSKNNKEEWLDITYPQFKGRIYCSYVKINGDFRKISEDSRTLVYKHTVRADAIIEQPFENPEAKVYGIIYEITGNAASPLQFMLTDSTKNFIRGALYFNAVPNADSIAPVSSYVEKDLRHLIETLRWKK
jgi:gliding motility-associated lipoprotein GldD